MDARDLETKFFFHIHDSLYYLSSTIPSILSLLYLCYTLHQAISVSSLILIHSAVQPPSTSLVSYTPTLALPYSSAYLDDRYQATSLLSLGFEFVALRHPPTSFGPFMSTPCRPYCPLSREVPAFHVSIQPSHLNQTSVLIPENSREYHRAACSSLHQCVRKSRIHCNRVSVSVAFTFILRSLHGRYDLKRNHNQVVVVGAV